MFNWKFYLSENPDLVKAGINNEKKALWHWTRFGKKEGRVAAPPSYEELFPETPAPTSSPEPEPAKSVIRHVIKPKRVIRHVIKPESVVEPEPEPVVEPEPEPVVEPESEPVVEPESEPVVDSEPVVEPESEPDHESEPDYESEPVVESELIIAPKPKRKNNRTAKNKTLNIK